MRGPQERFPEDESTGGGRSCSFHFLGSEAGREVGRGTRQVWESSVFCSIFIAMTTLATSSGGAPGTTALHVISDPPGFSGGSGKESACNAGDLGSIPGWRRSPGKGNGNPLQYSGLENPMNRGALQATVRAVAKRQT